jgi:hypothetical protein
MSVATPHVDEARKISNRKTKSAFQGMIKLDLEDLVGPTTLARKTLQKLNKYSVCLDDRENKYSLGLNVP